MLVVTHATLDLFHYINVVIGWHHSIMQHGILLLIGADLHFCHVHTIRLDITPTMNQLEFKIVYIVLQNSYFMGSCMTIKDSVLISEEHITWFIFEINNVTINESRCVVALSINNSKLPTPYIQ